MVAASDYKEQFNPFQANVLSLYPLKTPSEFITYAQVYAVSY